MEGREEVRVYPLRAYWTFSLGFQPTLTLSSGHHTYERSIHMYCGLWVCPRYVNVKSTACQPRILSIEIYLHGCINTLYLVRVRMTSVVVCNCMLLLLTSTLVLYAFIILTSTLSLLVSSFHIENNKATQISLVQRTKSNKSFACN